MNAPSWRGGVLAGVILLHAGAAAALQGLGREPPPPREVAPVLVAAILAEPEPEAFPPPASQPEPRPQARPAPRAAKPQPAPPATPAVASPAPVAEEPAAPPATAPAPATAPPRPPVQEPAAISCRIPAYPAEAKRRGETGTVLLQLLIDTEGMVVDQRVERSSGHAALDSAAMAALSRCKFKPGTLDGRPQQAWARLRYVWKLE